MLQDKEPEVRSEAVSKLPTLAKNCSPNVIVENVLPVINSYTVNDSSQHVKGSLALAICELSQYVGRAHTLQFIVPSVS